MQISITFVNANWNLLLLFWVLDLVQDEFLSVIILEEFLYLLTIVDMVVVTTFPPYDLVFANPSVIKFNHKFEFKSLAGISACSIYLSVWYFCLPIVTFHPLHLHATFASIFFCFPFAQEIWRSNNPQILTKLCLIFDTYDEFC